VRAGACPTEPGILIMTVTANRQWRLKRRPSGQFDQADFELATVPIPEMRDGEFLVRLTHLSVDPTQRIWAHEESYLPIQPIGDSRDGISAARHTAGCQRACKSVSRRNAGVRSGDGGQVN
jgi:NADPH-dependent curcumin reductase CurA